MSGGDGVPIYSANRVLDQRTTEHGGLMATVQVCVPVGQWTFNARYTMEADGRPCYSLVMTTPGQSPDDVFDFHLHCETPEELEREFYDMMVCNLRAYQQDGSLPHIDWQAIRDFVPSTPAAP